jgi:hypothetical protein
MSDDYEYSSDAEMSEPASSSGTASFSADEDDDYAFDTSADAFSAQRKARAMQGCAKKPPSRHCC